MAFKDRLKFLRNERGMTQEELAMDLELPPSTIRRYESSNEGMPKQERLQIIATYFGCSVDYLLERTDERQTEIKKENDYTPSRSKIDLIIKKIEDRVGVELSNDPIILKNLENTINMYAEMKKKNERS